MALGIRFFLEESSERVIGELSVTTRLAIGHEMIKLYFTGRRIIVSHRSKVGAASIPATFMFGSIGGALSSLFGRGKKGNRKPRSEYPSPNKILASDKDNFSIFFDEIVRVDLTKSSFTNIIAILTGNDKFDFSCRSRFELILALFEYGLTSKLKVYRND